MPILRGDAEISSSLRVTVSLFSGMSNGQCEFLGSILIHNSFCAYQKNRRTNPGSFLQEICFRKWRNIEEKSSFIYIFLMNPWRTYIVVGDLCHKMTFMLQSWEALPPDTATFTPDITPLILAAHRDNYEIIKILLDRGATLPMPHDVR